MRVLFAGIFKRQVKYFLRYQFDSISGLVSLLVIFTLLFYGARALIGGDPGSEETLSGIVVGYMVWMLGIFGYSENQVLATEEAVAGTLEQLAMSPFGLRAVMVTSFVAGLIQQLVLMSVMTVLMMTVSGRWLHLDLVSIVPLVLLTLVGVYGMGLMFAGLAIVFKRMQGFMQIIQFVMILFVAAPLERFGALKYAPLAFGRDMIHRVMVGTQSIFTIPGADTLFLVGHAAVWLAAGLFVFGRLERVARERALLGHY